MRKARVFVHGIEAGILEHVNNQHYRFLYHAHYQGPPISLTMPLKKEAYEFSKFPAFFEGLLPEGTMLAAVLRKYKLDRHDYFGQLVTMGQDLVGAVTVEEMI